MTNEFFTTKAVIDLLNGYSAILRGITTTDSFEEERNDIILRIFQLFINNPSEWDMKSSYNIQLLKNSFIDELEKKSMVREDINSIFTTCFRLCVEPSLFSPSMENRSHVIKLLKDFGIYKLDEFDPINKEQLQYALREMPIDIVKDFLKSDEVESFKDFKDKLKAGIEFASTWEEYFEKQKQHIEGLKESLKGYESAFNFVGLYDGFNSLSTQKKRDIGWSRFVLFLLAATIPLPLLFEYFYISQSIVQANTATKLISIIPFLSFTLILIYYFRVVLLNYTSLRTQIMQIELRKSLCQFIQSYADYSNKIKTSNPDALSKFEDIIFSNIMSSDEKIPSTFDGIEQVASILSSLKSK